MSKYLFIFFIMSVITFLPSCRDNQKKRETSGESQVIIQFPGVKDIISSPFKTTFFKKHVDIVSHEMSISIMDTDKTRTGWALWHMPNIPANQEFIIRLRMKKSYESAQYSMIQIKFITNKQNLGKYHYLILPNTGKVIPRQQATKEMSSVTSDGEKWIFDFKTLSPAKISTLQLLLMPTVGKKVTTGSVDIEGISIFRTAKEKP